MLPVNHRPAGPPLLTIWAELLHLLDEVGAAHQTDGHHFAELRQLVQHLLLYLLRARRAQQGQAGSSLGRERTQRRAAGVHSMMVGAWIAEKRAGPRPRPDLQYAFKC